MFSIIDVDTTCQLNYQFVGVTSDSDIVGKVGFPQKGKCGRAAQPQPVLGGTNAYNDTITNV